MNIDLVSLHSKSCDRIQSKWNSSILLNTIAVGWIIAIYSLFYKVGGTNLVPFKLKLAITALHFPAYSVSCINLMREYKTLNHINKSIESNTPKNRGDSNAYQILTEKTLSIKYPYILAFVVLIHAVYAILVYNIAWYPSEYFQMPIPVQSSSPIVP